MLEDDAISKNLGLIIKLARSFKPSNATELEEYIQLGRIGFLKAFRKYDPDRGALSTMAWHYIRWEIIQHLNKQRKHKVKKDIEEPSDTTDEKITSMDCENLWEFLPSNLNDKEKNIVELKLQGHTYKEIGQKLNYTQHWISKLYKSAIKKIKYANKA